MAITLKWFMELRDVHDKSCTILREPTLSIIANFSRKKMMTSVMVMMSLKMTRTLILQVAPVTNEAIEIPITAHVPLGIAKRVSGSPIINPLNDPPKKLQQLREYRAFRFILHYILNDFFTKYP